MLEAIPFATAELVTGPVHALGDTPRGQRMIAELTAARFTGERFNAEMVSASAADWAFVRPDGAVEVDVRLPLRTDDGALVGFRYEGIMDFARGDEPVLSMMRFETSDERYEWLNRLQAVGKGTVTAELVRYDVYELR